MENSETTSPNIPETPETPSTPVSPKPDKRLKAGLLGIAGLVVTVILTSAGYWYGTKSANLKTQSIKPQPKTQTLTPTSVLVDGPTFPLGSTDNWKIYINNNYQYQFRYPSTWVLIANKDYVTLYSENSKEVPSETNARVAVYPENPTLYNSVDINEPVGTRREIGDKVFEEKIADLLLNGQVAAKYSIDVLPGSQTDAVPGILVKVKIDSLALYIRLYTPYETTPQNLIDTFSQILSTFQFIT